MHRCLRLPSLAALACTLPLLAASAWLPAQAQAAPPAAGARTFPQQALRGELVIGALPEVTLNGQALRTTPGFRLLGTDGRLLMGHTLAGQKLRVNYVIEPSTQWLHTAWILTPEEAARKRPD